MVSPFKTEPESIMALPARPVKFGLATATAPRGHHRQLKNNNTPAKAIKN